LLELDHEIKRLRKESEDEGAREKLARLEEKRGELRLSEYGRRVRQHPTDLSLRSRYGKALYDAGRLDEAIAEFQKAVNDPKGRVQALAHLGGCFRKKGLHDLAVKQYGQALEGASDADKSTLELRYRLGEVLEEKGAAAEALAEYSRIYERDINFRDVAQKIGSLQKGP
jgi:tetratricopeptide (TPR) repeat protein